MLHQNPKIVSAVVVSARLARTLIYFSAAVAFTIAIIGALAEVGSVLAGPETRVSSAFHLFGAYNNFTSWYQSTAFSLVAMLWFCLSANVGQRKRGGFMLGSAAMIYMSIGELTNWDHGNWARLANYAPGNASQFVLPALGFVAAGGMALWFRFMFENRGVFLFALLIYSLGAFGFELISTEVAIHYGTGGFYVATGSIEELLEMAGCFLLLAGTLKLAVPTTERAPNQ